MAVAYDEVAMLKDSEHMGEMALLASVKLNRLLHVEGQKVLKVMHSLFFVLLAIETSIGRLSQTD